MRLILTSAFLTFLLGAQSVHSAEYAPKLTLRTGGGILTNSGSNGGQTGVSGGFELLFNYFLTPKLAAGGGYVAYFDLTKGRMPISGYNLSGRYYYYGNGTVIRTSGEWSQSEFHDQIAAYVGGDYSYRNYYLGPDPLGSSASDNLEGNFSTGNLNFGVDYTLNEKFELNGELSTSLFTFAASDERVKISQTMIVAGITYVF